MLPEAANRIGCREARLLMPLHIKGDPSLTKCQREALEAHLATCASCRQEYEENEQLIFLLQRFWGPIGEGTQELQENSGCQLRGQGVASPHRRQAMTAEEGWEDLKRRCPGLAEVCQGDERGKMARKLVFRIGTILAAACILIATGIAWLALRNGGVVQTVPGMAASSGSGMRAPYGEIITSKGREPLVLNQPVVTGDQPREILLGDMHRVVMNRNTKAIFSASSARNDVPHAGTVPYEIQLVQGELYVEVVPGNLFAIKTANARLDITGTKFDVRADGDRTELILLKGSVRFSQSATSDNFVDVTAGRASVIIGRMAPTLPRETDAAAATAWARDLALANAIAGFQPDTDQHLLDSIRDCWADSEPLDLDSIDYVRWRDGHRDWFVSQFPWIFQIQKHLSEQYGIDVDYVELLMISGDIRQFNYPRSQNEPIPIFNAGGVKRIAAHYGIAVSAMLDAVGNNMVSVADTPVDQSLIGTAEEYRSAMQLWQSDVTSLNNQAENKPTDNRLDDVLMFTWRAGTYLTNTRVAAWVWAHAYPEKAAALFASWKQSEIPFFDAGIHGTCEQWLARLQRDALAADGIGQIALKVLAMPRTTGCDMRGDALRTQLAKKTADLLVPEALR